jgi:GxxExxY protein
VPLVYRSVTLDVCYWLDMLIDQCVVVELKSVEALAPIHEAQMLTYLRLTCCPVGLLINFNVPLLKDGIRRVVNPYLDAD